MITFALSVSSYCTVIAAVLIVRKYISKQCMNQISLPGERKAIFFSGSACVSYSCVMVYNACQIRLVMT